MREDYIDAAAVLIRLPLHPARREEIARILAAASEIAAAVRSGRVTATAVGLRSTGSKG